MQEIWNIKSEDRKSWKLPSSAEISSSPVHLLRVIIVLFCSRCCCLLTLVVQVAGCAGRSARWSGVACRVRPRSSSQGGAVGVSWTLLITPGTSSPSLQPPAGSAGSTATQCQHEVRTEEGSDTSTERPEQAHHQEWHRRQLRWRTAGWRLHGGESLRGESRCKVIWETCR